MYLVQMYRAKLRKGFDRYFHSSCRLLILKQRLHSVLFSIVYKSTKLTVTAASRIHFSSFQLKILEKAHRVQVTRVSRKGHNSWNTRRQSVSIAKLIYQQKLFILNKIKYIKQLMG